MENQRNNATGGSHLFGLEPFSAVCGAPSDYGNVIQRWEKAIVPLTDEIDNLRSRCMYKHTHTQAHNREEETLVMTLFLCLSAFV